MNSNPPYRLPEKAAQLGMIGLFILFVVGPLLCALAPRAMAMLFIVGGLCALPILWLQRAEIRFKPAHIFLAAAGSLLLFFGVVRSPAEGAAQEDVLYFIFALLALWGLLVTCRTLPECYLSRLPVWLLIGTLGGTLLVAIEWLFNMPLHRLISVITGDTLPPLYALDRTIVLISLLFWPVAGTLAAYWRQGLASIFALVALSLAVVSQTSSQASLIGLATGLTAYLATRIAPSLFPYLLRIAVPAAFLLAPFILSLASWITGLAPDHPLKSFWHHANADERLAIWRHTVVVILDKPWWGHGIEALRAMPFYAELKHCHNGPLQVWAEFGLAGIIALCAALRCLIIRMQNLPTVWRPAAFAGFMAWLVIFCVGYGIWQPWWIATGFVLIIHVTVLSRLTPKQS